MIEQIKPLEKKDWQGHVLEFRYTAHNYYDVEIKQELSGFNVSFIKKPFDIPYEKKPDNTDKLFQAWWDDVQAWGIVKDEKLVAVIETAVEEWSNRIRVTEFCVDSTYRRMGIGCALMDIAVNRSKTEKRRAVILETQSCNEGAISFYLNYGFSLTGFDACCYGNNDIHNKEVRIEFGLFT